MVRTQARSRPGTAADALHAARSGGMQVLTILAQTVLPLTHIVLARLFGRTVFGAYQSSVALIEVLTRGGTGGADKAMLRYVAAARAIGDEDAVTRSLGSGFRLCLLVSGLGALALVLGAGTLARLTGEWWLATTLPRMAPSVIFLGLSLVAVQSTLAARSTHQNFWARGVAEPTLLLLAGVIAWSLGAGLSGLAAAHAAATACSVVVALLLWSRLFGRRRMAAALRAQWLTGFARFSLPMGATELLGALRQRADLLMLTAFVGAPAAGVYAAAEFLGRSIANIRYAFDSIAASVLSEAYHRGQRERVRYNLALMTRWVATVSAPIAATLIAVRRPLLALYGPGFVDGATAMVLLCLSHLVNSVFGLVPWLLMVSGRSRLLLIDNLVSALANIGLGLALIPRLGLVGAALAAVTTMVVLQSLYLTEVYVLERTHPFEPSLVKPFCAAAVTLAVQHAMARWLGPAMAVPSILVTAVVLYTAMLWLLGPPPEDVALVRRAFDRLRRRPGRV